MQNGNQQGLAGLQLQEPEPAAARTAPKKRANELDGATWTRNSISIWSNIKKTPEEMRLRHPALFPTALVTRLIECFAGANDRVVLDPFSGVGSTVIAAEALGKLGIGIDLSEEFTEKARQRSRQMTALPGGERRLIVDDAFNLLNYVEPDSVDLVVTSPPYWDILLQKRSADYKEVRHYGESAKDLGRIPEYQEFVRSLQDLFRLVNTALRPGKYCCVVVMDVRKKDKLYLLHADLAEALEQIGLPLDDIIIWDRRHEYNNLRPLGYPSVFRINRVHEYILVFQKPT